MSPPPRRPMSPQRHLGERSDGNRAANPSGPNPTPAPIRHDGADVLHRLLRHQPVDGHVDARRHRPCGAPVGDPAVDLPRARPHRRHGRAGRRTARHGLRRQRRTDRRRQGRRRPLRLPTASRRSRCPRRVDEQQWIRARLHPPRQRGPGRPARRGIDDLGRIRLPDRSAGSCRGRADHRPARDEPRIGRPAVLSPRHRPGRARRHDDRVLPARLQRRRPRAVAGAVPRRHRGGHRRRVRPRAQRRLRRQTRPDARERHRHSQSRSPTPASNPSASICPNCSRAADPSNAAHWRCIRDHPGYRDD